MKKIFLAMPILLFLPFSASAAVYGGIGIGYANIQNDQTLHTSLLPPDSERSDQINYYAGGGRFKFMGGYEKYFWGHYFSDIEASLELGDSNSINTYAMDATQVQESFTHRSNYGVAWRGGSQFSEDFRGYLTVGYLRGCFRDEFVTNADNNSREANTWLNGVDYGLGVEFAQSNHVTWRLEYLHGQFETFNRVFPDFTVSSQPTNNQINLSININYDFTPSHAPSRLNTVE